jgi:hypothetical protein
METSDGLEKWYEDFCSLRETYVEHMAIFDNPSHVETFSIVLFVESFVVTYRLILRED